MSKRKIHLCEMKTHIKGEACLFTVCGKSPLFDGNLITTDNPSETTCKNCLKREEAEDAYNSDK